jgi:hypothetical protein
MSDTRPTNKVLKKIEKKGGEGVRTGRRGKNNFKGLLFVKRKEKIKC